MMPTLSALLFWFSFALLFYTFIGYPLHILVLARMARPRPANQSMKELPTVTVVLAVCNEAQRIVARLKNLLAANYPTDRLNLIVVSDGSTDATVETIRALNQPRIQLIAEAHRAGKARCLNLAVAAARSELIVFADARQRFEPDTIPKLVAHFGDPLIGAVSGELVVEAAVSATGGGVDSYWRLEKMIRRAEARWASSIGCTGAVYAIRRAYYQPIPADTILDDVVIPMQIALQGYRVGFDPMARAFDPQTLEPAREQIRKPRTLAGNYQMLVRHPAWLLPWRNRLWWQLICHKYLRLGGPFFLIFMFAANLLLLGHIFYWLPFICQSLCYGLAICGLTRAKNANPLFSIPAGFVFLNWMALDGLRYHLRGTYQQGQWPDAHSHPNGT